MPLCLCLNTSYRCTLSYHRLTIHLFVFFTHVSVDRYLPFFFLLLKLPLPPSKWTVYKEVKHQVATDLERVRQESEKKTKESLKNVDQAIKCDTVIVRKEEGWEH